MNTALSRRFSRGLMPFFGGEPFRVLHDQMDELFDRFSRDFAGEEQTGMMIPSVDVSETDNALELRFDVPGMKSEDIDIEMVGNTLRVTGERKEEHDEKGKTFHRVERSRGAFSRSITLPCAVKEEDIDAEYHDGVLTISLPKCEEAKTRKIQVKSKDRIAEEGKPDEGEQTKT